MKEDINEKYHEDYLEEVTGNSLIVANWIYLNRYENILWHKVMHQ